ncbi:MAG: hypothetical protein ACP5SH_23585 [Syntrophobacteraceae bacterium]
MNAAEFMAKKEGENRTRRKSVMAPWLEDMLILRANGYTYEEVREFLALNGVHVKIPGIIKYVHRHQGTPGKPGRRKQAGDEPARKQSDVETSTEAKPDNKPTSVDLRKIRENIDFDKYMK